MGLPLGNPQPGQHDGAFSGPAPVTGASGSRGARSGHVILTKPERGRRRQMPLALQEVFISNYD